MRKAEGANVEAHADGAPRDRRRSSVRRITAWTAAGSLAAAAGLAALVGVTEDGGAPQQGNGTTGGTSADTEGGTGDTGTSDSGSGDSGSGDTLQQPGQAPSSSDGPGSVTSGGS
ncbi:hypothetical protein [Actinomadura fibrosa]|uniref:Uncharacterized protein n=1 Tax=Actinomadura fibrosa TaxID=111802 RepID=A0ABW2XV06_9ACTN|nr:hypothetical protein [Actinomadura fibrosa]